MDRIRSILTGHSAAKNNHNTHPEEYEPLRTSSDDVRQSGNTSESESETYKANEAPFSWFEYTIFALVGVAMLWAW